MTRFEDTLRERGLTHLDDVPITQAERDAIVYALKAARQYLDTGRGDLDGALARLDAGVSE